MPAGVFMAGFGGDTIGLPSTIDVEALDSGGGVANATFGLNSNGTWVTSDAQGGSWLGGSNGSAYEVRATLLGGSVGGSGTGTWLNLGTTRSWTRGQVGVGSSFGTVLIEIRPTSGSVMDSATIGLTATVS